MTITASGVQLSVLGQTALVYAYLHKRCCLAHYFIFLPYKTDQSSPAQISNLCSIYSSVKQTWPQVRNKYQNIHAFSASPSENRFL